MSIFGIKTVQDIFTIYLKIPMLQRDYVWRKPEWERLWNDIADVNDKLHSDKPDKNAQMFLGTITLKEGESTKKGESTQYDVIDGQQRLTTLCVLRELLGDLKGDLQNDKTKQLIRGMKISRPRDKDIDDSDDSKDIYCNCYNFFAAKFEEMASGKDRGSLCEALKSIIDRRVLLHISEASGSKNVAFENLNATGEPLVYTDLILNHLISMKKNEKVEEANIECVRQKWLKILKSISDEELPYENEQLVNEDDDSDADTVENDDDSTDTDRETTEEAAAADSDTAQTADNTEQPLKPLKIKKFFNALHCVTLPVRESFPETVDDFIRMFERLGKSFYEKDSIDVDFILVTMEKWAGYYLEYINPAKYDTDYTRSLWYLRTLGNTSLIPAVMRTLFRIKKRELSCEDAENIFKAMVVTQLLRNVYIERENTTDTNDKLRVTDYIYIAAGKNYDALMSYLIDNVTLEKYRAAFRTVLENNDDQLWKTPYNSGLSKTILAIGYDEQHKNNDKVYQIEKKDNPFQVEHMVARMVEGGYAAYGYDDFTVNELWNLNLLESSINNSVSNKKPEDKCAKWQESKMKEYYPTAFDNQMKNNQRGTLVKLSESFRAYCTLPKSAKNNSVQNTKKDDSSLYVVSYIKNGLYYEKALVDKEKKSGIDTENNSIVYRITISHDGKYERDPKTDSKDNKILNYYLTDGDNRLELSDTESENSKSKKIRGRKAEAIKLLIGAAFIHIKVKNQLGDSKTIDEAEGIANGIIAKALEKSKLARKDENGNYTLYGRKVTEENQVLVGDELYLLNIVNNSSVIDKMTSFYELIFDNKDNKDNNVGKIGFWVKLTYPEMHRIKDVKGNYHYIRTRYRNVGDPGIYSKFVLDQEQNKKLENNTGSNTANANSTPLSFVSDFNQEDFYLSAKHVTFKDLLTNYPNLTIPEYQRSYVWGEKQFKALINTISGENAFLGTIVLYEQKNGKYSVVDGQQRLTTLGILYNAVLTNLKQSGSDNFNFIIKNDNSAKQNARDYFKDKTVDLKKICNIGFNLLIIKKDAPETFQYKVFGTINGCGRRLTLEEKVKNFLYIKNSEADEKTVDDVNTVIKYPGFIKAFTEMKSQRAFPEADMYDEFKKCCGDYIKSKTNNDWLTGLSVLAKKYAQIKGLLRANLDPLELNKNIIEQDKTQLKLWLKLYQTLGVNTADSLLLYAFTEAYQQDFDKLTEFMRRLSMMYFLLYVDDPNGNCKKSINSKLPEIIGTDKYNNKELIERFKAGMKGDKANGFVSSELFASQDKPNFIFEKLKAFDLADTTRKSVSRFVLTLCELWCGLEPKMALKLLSEENPPEIEHIFPASRSSESDRPDYLFRLENVCLLERSINGFVGNKMLWEKDKNGQRIGKLIKVKDKSSCYYDSDFKMPNMFYEENEEKGKYTDLVDENGKYGKNQAENRIEKLHDLLIPQNSDTLYRQMIREVLDDSANNSNTDQ